VALVALWVFRRRADGPKDRIRHYYDMFCNKLEKAGLARAPYEGSREYLARITTLFPIVGDKAEMIISYYQDLHYGDTSDAELKQQFVRCVKQFRVKSIDKDNIL